MDLFEALLRTHTRVTWSQHAVCRLLHGSTLRQQHNIYPNQIRTFLKLLNCKIFSLNQIFAINPGNIRRISCVEAWCGVCMLYAGAQGVTPAGRGSRGRHQPRLSFNSLQPPASHITTEMRRHTAVLGWAVAGEKLLWISAGVWRQLVCKSKVSL